MTVRYPRDFGIRVGDRVKIHSDWFMPNWATAGLLGFAFGPILEVDVQIGITMVRVDWGTDELPEWINARYVEVIRRADG